MRQQRPRRRRHHRHDVKAYVTPTKIGDGNKYEQKALVEVNVKAKAGASPGTEWNVVGVAGQWWDDGDDTPESGADIFFCSRDRDVAGPHRGVTQH